MAIKIHPHARERMRERGATEEEVMETLKSGEEFAVKFGRIGFRRNFSFGGIWRGKKFNTKQIEVIAVKEGDDLIVVTTLVKYF